MRHAVQYLWTGEARSWAPDGGALREAPLPASGPLCVVVDYADEAYVLATLPFMRGRDAALLRRRRLEREFPGASLTTLVTLRRRPRDGVSDAVMIAVNGGPGLAETLGELGAKYALRGVYTPALLAAAWLRRARLQDRRVLVVLPTPAGVRLVFLDGPRPTLSRLTGPLSPASTSTEIARTVQYLQNTQRVERGEPVELWFWGMTDAEAAACLPTGVPVRPGAAPQVAGLPDPERAGLTALLELVSEAPTSLQLAPDSLRLGWRAGHVERAGRIAAAAALLLGAGAAVLFEVRAEQQSRAASAYAAERAAMETQAQQFDALLAQRGLSLAELQTLPEAEQRLGRGTLPLDAGLQLVARAFGAQPDVEVASLELRAASFADAPPPEPATDAGEGGETDGAADMPAPGGGEAACTDDAAGAEAALAVNFKLADGLGVRRRDAALAFVRDAVLELDGWQAGPAARVLGRRDTLVVTAGNDAAADAMHWSLCLRRSETS